ncbi:hypothetical protein [Psychrobacter vallis]|uniref:hypothetical protein n=1 Tax=Psychrobacter vallis TaxID=248451 RepID=UPI0019199784|nr:hypothetical protein [Psychrobacter vallis]
MGSDSNKSSENYPKANVITAYSFFGGAIGGGVIGLVIAMFMVLEAVLQGIVGSLVLALLAIPTFAFLGSLLGLIPAILTGCLVASLKLYRNDKGLSQSAIIGTISTVICALLLMGFNNFTFSLAACIFATMIGSISGYLTGLFFLPKS